MLVESRAQCARIFASAALFMAAATFIPVPAFAQDDDDEAAQAVNYGTLSGPPVMAVVSIKDQRISLYDAAGGVLRSGVSSGRPDYETPVGTYSVLEKNKEHYSNVYDDAAMPFMQRITWSGVALHQGELPGYPASHGCVRLPQSFAEHIFPMTKVGMRVVIAHDNVAPVAISHDHLFKPAPLGQTVVTTRAAYQPTGVAKQGSVFEPNLANWPARQTEVEALRSVWFQKSAVAEQRKAEVENLKGPVAEKAKPQAVAAKVLKTAEKAKKAADDAVTRASAVLAGAKDPAKIKPFETAKSKAEAALAAANERVTQAQALADAAFTAREHRRADSALRTAERAKQAAERQIARAERDLEAAQSPARYKKQDDALARATAAAAAASEKYTAALAAFETADKELERVKKALADATATMDTAVAAASEAKRMTIPVSMFVSLKTQRLYVRQGHEPVAEYPISITDPGKPIGTHVFTAVDYEKGAEALRWTAVSLNRRAGREVAQLTSRKNKIDVATEPYPTDAAAAAAALDRVTIPEDVLNRFSTSMYPGSSLIVSDEGLSKETNNATDFVVLISTEPQGGIKRRPKPQPQVQRFYADDGYGYYGSGYRVYGRPIRIAPKKNFFDWW